MVFIDGGHSFKAANNDYVSWSTKIKKNGALVIHDIFENHNEGGQAPVEIFQKALKNNFEIYERVDTLACLKSIEDIKNIENPEHTKPAKRTTEARPIFNFHENVKSRKFQTEKFIEKISLYLKKSQGS